MTYNECLSKINLDCDILVHHTYKGTKMDGLYIVPEIGNIDKMISQSLSNKFDLRFYLDLPLNVYVVYNKKTANNFSYQKLDTILENLDDNSWWRF